LLLFLYYDYKDNERFNGPLKNFAFAGFRSILAFYTLSAEPYITDYFKNDKSDLKSVCNLSLFVENQLFMFAVFNEDFTSVYEVGHVKINSHKNELLTDKVNFLLNNHRLLQRDFKSIYVAALNHTFSLIPEAFVMAENSKDVLSFSVGESEARNTYQNKFDQVNFCYTFQDDFVPFMERTLRKANTRHAGAVTIDLLFGNHSLKNCDLFLNFNLGVFELAAKSNNKLLYYNVFNYDTNEDVLYYLLFMMEQYHLNPLTCKVVVAGQMDAESELFKSIKKYIKHVNFAVSDKSFSSSFSDLKIPQHYFFTLLNQHLCVL
jgi:hypothetical protein